MHTEFYFEIEYFNFWLKNYNHTNLHSHRKTQPLSYIFFNLNALNSDMASLPLWAKRRHIGLCKT